MKVPSVSVVIPCRNEEGFISDCLLSIINSDFDENDLEILIVDGNSDDKTVEIVKNLAVKYPFIKLFNNPDKVVPHAMNIGIKNANGKIIVRMDAHSIYPNNYISELVLWMEKLGADNIGGVWDTTAANSSLQATTIALSTSHKFGIGDAQYRLEQTEPLEVDTVPFGCYKKEVFENIGFYDEDLVRNQDDELNARLIQNGGKIFLLPDLKITYFARATFSKMYKMFYQYGYFKPLVNLKLKKPATLRQFVPPIFVLFLVLGMFISLGFTPFIYFYIFGLSLYFSINLLVSFKISKSENNLMLFPFLVYSFFLIHLAYGVGYWMGIVDFVIRKKHTKNKINIQLSR